MLERVWKKGFFLNCWWECKLIQARRKTVWRFLKKLGIKPPCDPETPLLGVYPEETKTERDTCIQFFFCCTIYIPRTWNQPRCPSTDKWIKKFLYIYTMELLPSHKKECIKPVLMRWMNTEPIIHSEVSQIAKDKYSILMHKYRI